MEEGYYIEFMKVDNMVKVTAIDPDTGTEASVICPASTAKNDMTNLAIRKLHYIQKKNRHES